MISQFAERRNITLTARGERFATAADRLFATAVGSAAVVGMVAVGAEALDNDLVCRGEQYVVAGANDGMHRLISENVTYPTDTDLRDIHDRLDTEFQSSELTEGQQVVLPVTCG